MSATSGRDSTRPGGFPHPVPDAKRGAPEASVDSMPGMSTARRVMIVGLDCAPPQIAFDDMRDERVVGEYMLDVPDFRTDQKDRIMRDITEMTRRRFQLARHLRDTREWDFFAMVEMGTDRLHHGFWRYYDPGHPDYEPGNPYEEAF